MKSCYYDKTGRRLVCITESAAPEFWDGHWEQCIDETCLSPPAHRSTVWITKKYSTMGATILEVGCCMGDKVYALCRAGFKAKGIRRIRAENDVYQTLEMNDNSLRRSFYQYALDPDIVIEEFTSLGFKAVQKKGSSFDFLAEEARWFKPVDALLHLLPFGLRA